MKVNLPTSMSQTRADVSLKSTDRPEPEATGLFSLQMHKILHQDDDESGIPDRYPNARSGYGEAEDDSPDAASKSKLSATGSDHSGDNARGPVGSNETGTRESGSRAPSEEGNPGANNRVQTESEEIVSESSKGGNRLPAVNNGQRASHIPAPGEAETEAEGGSGKAHVRLSHTDISGTEFHKAGISAASDSQRQASQTQADSSDTTAGGKKTTIPERADKTLTEVPPAGGSTQPGTGLSGTEAGSNRNAWEEDFEPVSQIPANSRIAGRVTDDRNPHLKTDGNVESLRFVTAETDRKEEGVRQQSLMDTRDVNTSESGKFIPLDRDMVENPLKHRNSFRESVFPQKSEVPGNEISNRLPAGDANSSGENSESGDNNDRIAAAPAFRGGGNASGSGERTNTNPAKGFQAEIGNHLATGTTNGSVSQTAAGMHATKPTAPHANDLLSQVTERIQFLIRDGGDVVRIRLQPDEFGRMEIRAESTSRGMFVRIAAETGSVKGVLENNLHMLQQNLLEHGLKVDRIQVELHEFFDSQSAFGHSAKSGNSNPEQNQKAAHRNFNTEEDGSDLAAADDDGEGAYRPEARFYTVA